MGRGTWSHSHREGARKGLGGSAEHCIGGDLYVSEPGGTRVKESYFKSEIFSSDQISS